MGDFDREKLECMKKMASIDKSKKGSIDKLAMPLLELVNQSENYYSTSSCSGRILLMDKNVERKDLCEWLLASHDEIIIEDAKTALKKGGKNIWFKMEGAIFHFACKDLISAQKLVDLAKNIGFKRSGIMASTRRFMVELINTENMALPIMQDNKLLIGEDYLSFLIGEANAKLARNKAKIDKFVSEFANLE